MNRYDGIPERIEQFMADTGSTERWVTVQELRDHFGLSRYQCNTVSGFLRRISSGPFRSFAYIVLRIERGGVGSSCPLKARYLVTRRRGPDARPGSGYSCQTDRIHGKKTAECRISGLLPEGSGRDP